MAGKDPDNKSDSDRFEEVVKEMEEQGFDHPYAKPALIGAAFGGLLGYAAMDGVAGVLLGVVFGGIIAILIQIEK